VILIIDGEEQARYSGQTKIDVAATSWVRQTFSQAPQVLNCSGIRPGSD